jgi:arginine decarboxylase
MLKEDVGRWSATEAEELYEVQGWGNGYFSVGKDGTVQVHPERNPQRAVDLMDLVNRLKLRGLELPVLIRFNDILKDRLAEIHGAFDKAMQENEYRGKYSCVYPIKVNQQRHVVEQVLKHGQSFGFGLEAGSKPELLAVIALLEDDRPIICNGFKDAGFIEMALMAQKIGRLVIPVIEKYTELELILSVAERIGVRPHIGMRVKLAAKGAGRWQSSGGYRSKFGLTVTEVLKALDHLHSIGMADCFKLLHFHLGSQITNIRHVKGALIEAARIYTDLAGRGAALEYLDVGGGLGVDYDGSRTNFESSVNYTLQEYANDVIYHVLTVCDDAGVAHPHIISESGRAIAAYHSVLIFNVLGISSHGNDQLPETLADDVEQPLVDLRNTYNELSPRNVLESFHDAQESLEMAISAFAAGYMPLDQRSTAESYYWAICQKIRKMMSQMDEVPEELEKLPSMLADTYFCNFSLFQSLPDSWAIKQLFPVMPIHRLNEEPDRQAILGDITCDSDGKIDHFIDRRGVCKTLPLHSSRNGEPYYLGAFLLGAYQEILGDLHNLFGDTNAAHVSLGEGGELTIEAIVKGDTVTEVLNYVQFNTNELLDRLQTAVETAVLKNRIGEEEAGQFLKCYEEGLRGYTYLQ